MKKNDNLSTRVDGSTYMRADACYCIKESAEECSEVISLESFPGQVKKKKVKEIFDLTPVNTMLVYLILQTYHVEDVYLKICTNSRVNGLRIQQNVTSTRF